MKFHSKPQKMDKDREMSRETRYRLYNDERMAQQIRENSQELRELETRIRAAYVTKSLKLQLAEQEKQRLQEKLLLENEIQLMKQKLNDDLQRDRHLKVKLRMQQETHRKELLQQIADKQFKRKILYEEFLKEKIIIDGIMEKIQKEQIAYDSLYFRIFLAFFVYKYFIFLTEKFKRSCGKRNVCGKI